MSIKNTIALSLLVGALASPVMAEDRVLPDIMKDNAVPRPNVVGDKKEENTSGQSSETSNSGSAVSGSATGGAAEGNVTQAVIFPERLPVTFVDEVNLLDEDEQLKKDALNIRARFGGVVGTGDGAEKMREVIVRGTMNVKKASEDDKEKIRSQIEWTSVMRPDNNKMVLLPTPLASQFSTDGNTLKEAQTVSAQGDYEGVLNAVKSLYGLDGGQGGQGITSANNMPDKEGSIVDSAEAGIMALGNQAGLAGGGELASLATGNENNTDSGFTFKRPETIGAEGEEEGDPILGESADGCAPKVDLVAETVTITKKKTENGVPVGNCEPIGAAKPLERSYEACTDFIDKDELKAYQQYRRFWTDEGGSARFAETECQPDKEKAYDLVLNENGCRIVPDLAAMKATVHARLVYASKDGSEKVVEDCRAREDSRSFDLIQTVDGCSLRHDFDKKKSFEQKQTYYVNKDGGQEVVQSCSDTGTYFEHVDVTSHAQISPACEPVIDRKLNVAIKRYMTIVTVNDKAIPITQCTPNEEDSVSLVKTGEGCEGRFYDYTSAGQSFASARWYHTLDESGRTFVSECEMDKDVVFDHEMEIVGYVNDDAARISRPKTRVYFISDVGEIEVSGAKVRDGAPEIPYVKIGSEEKLSGEITYQGDTCSAFQQRVKMAIYERSDGTEFEAAEGEGTPVGPLDACTASPEWKLTSGLKYTDGSCVGGMVDGGGSEGGSWYSSCAEKIRYLYVEGTGVYKIVRADGKVVSEETKTANYYFNRQYGNGSGYGYKMPYGEVPTPTELPRSFIIEQNNLNGWYEIDSKFKVTSN